MKQSKNKKELKSEFSYNRLWKLLIDRNIKKGELQEMSEVSAASANGSVFYLNAERKSGYKHKCRYRLLAFRTAAVFPKKAEGCV